MSEYEFKDQLENKSYAELLEMENVLANKILVNSSVVNPQVSGGKLIGSSLHIPNEDASVYSFHVDNSGNAWWGSTNITTAVAKILNTGVATFTNVNITGGSVAVSTLNGTVAFTNLDLAVQGWSQTCIFSITGATQVNWAIGTFTTAGGITYNIAANNTGVMANKTYIYLQPSVSATEYQITTTASTAVGAGKCLVAIAQNAVGEATYQVMDGMGGQNIDAANIVANTITANELATSITYAGALIIDTAGNIRSGQTAYNTGTGWWLGNVATVPKFSIGNPAGNWITYDGVDLSSNKFGTLAGDPTKFYFLGSNIDGFNTYSTFTGSVTRYLDITIMSTPANGDNANLYSGSPNLYTFNTDMEYSILAKLSSVVGTVRGFIGIGNQGIATPVLAYNANNNDRVGFFFYDDQLWISTASGANKTSTQIMGITETNWNQYKIVFTAGVSAKFYVNGTLVGTHTTNLPDSGIAPMVSGISATDATARTLSIFNNYTFNFVKP
jgi:hypothetical protein